MSAGPTKARAYDVTPLNNGRNIATAYLNYWNICVVNLTIRICSFIVEHRNLLNLLWILSFAFLSERFQA